MIFAQYRYKVQENASIIYRSLRFIRQFICQKMAFKLANKLRQISHFDNQILTTHLPAFLLPSLEITFFLRSFSMRYLTILIERPMVTIWNLLGDADPDTVRILQHLGESQKHHIQLSNEMGIKKETLGKKAVELQNEGVLPREGSKKTGSWKVTRSIHSH